ncbi:MAG: 50S ribosomal protein L24 [bacterium]
MAPRPPAPVRKFHLKKGDKVMVLSGEERGKTGTIGHVYRETGRVLVEGVNLVKKASRPVGRMRQAGIVDVPQPLHISNVMRVCPHCDKPTRFTEVEREDGRFWKCRHCGEFFK